MSDDTPPPGEQIARTRAIIPPGPAGRMALAGMPVERSENFGKSAKRLLGRLRPERARAILVICFALGSVTMAVLGPKILGQATNVIVDGLRGTNGGGGIDFNRLHHVLFLGAALYISSSVLQWTQAFLLAGVVQRTMRRLRSDVEDKLTSATANATVA